ncbi:MAG: M1 family aminopeptidase, partial [Bacteroidota bacterium]
IVDPPYHGIRSSAMEYPTLVTGAGLSCFPDGIRTTESINIHEIVHQYFMQLLATNEQEEAWMDEGFTSYYQTRIVDHYYGHIIEEPYTGFRSTDAAWRRTRFLSIENPKIDHPGKAGWKFRNDSYHPMVYGKSALFLHTLEGLVGREMMDRIMQTYFEQWKFKHPCGRDFLSVVNTMTGKDMTSVFEQIIYGTDACDYAITAINNIPLEEKLGRFDTKEDCLTEPSTTGIYQSEIIVSRLEGVRLPVQIRIDFEDGSTETVNWDGLARAKTLTYQRSAKVVAAVVDPDFKLPIDQNRINNSLVISQAQTGVWKYVVNALLWVQQFMESVAILV